LAAIFLTILFMMFQGMEHFHEGGQRSILGSLSIFFNQGLVGRSDGSSNVGFRARAACTLMMAFRLSSFTSRFIANKFALRTRAQIGLFAFPIAFSRFAHWDADR